ncbi:MAG: MFS transporter [Bacteroidales bacterium]|nr:MFS transporter [Bacteroidales bacterium]
MEGKNRITKLLPVLLAFFIMGYCDLVGIATNYLKQDFSLGDTAANAFSIMMFLWFLVLSVPTGMLMNRIGRKKTVLLSMVITLLGLLVPFVSYSMVSMVIVFSLIGIGNTLIQVSLNPLVAGLVSPEKQPSFLTLGQFIKAIASFLAPILAVQAALRFGNWKILFAVFAVIDIAAMIYLACTQMQESDEKKEISSFASCIKMLGQGTILMLFIGIVMHVGIDVGVNITAPKILQERAGMTLDQAGYATSLYFLVRTFSCLAGSFILSRYSASKFFIISTILILLGVLGLLFFKSVAAIYVSVGLIGAGNSNVFSIIFSNALRTVPEKDNEISGLLIMGISGGALVPVVMGAASDATGSQTGAVLILAVCIAYLLFLIPKLVKLEKTEG